MKLFSKIFKRLFPPPEVINEYFLIDALYGFTGRDLEHIKKSLALCVTHPGRLHSALNRMAISIFDSAFNGSKKLALFENMGICKNVLRVATTQTYADQFTLIAMKCDKIENQSTKVAAVLEIFDRQGLEVMPLISTYIEQRNRK